MDHKKPFTSGCTACHGADLTGGFGPSCYACHEKKWDETSGSGSPDLTFNIRDCEGCHGPDSLHNIQADSPRVPTGTTVVGGEDAGYGHVGRDAGPGDSDCWGCHGFAMSLAPGSGPLIPTIYSADLSTATAGTDTTVVVTGSAFTNMAGGVLFESQVSMTAADGSSVTLPPSFIDRSLMAVTIPADTAPGNYDLRAVKAEFSSNPVPISIVPEVVITEAVSDGVVTIAGSGFGRYAEGSGTMVTGTVAAGKGRGKKAPNDATVELATILSWINTKIVAQFVATPKHLTVYSVYGTAASEVDAAASGRRNGGKSSTRHR